MARSRRGKVRDGAAEQEEVTRLLTRLPELAIMICFVGTAGAQEIDG